MGRLFALLLNPAVNLRTKLLFLVIGLGYLLWPADLMPFVPFDDLLVLLLSSLFFTRKAESELSGSKRKPPGGNKSEDVIDTEGRVVEDGDEQP